MLQRRCCLGNAVMKGRVEGGETGEEDGGGVERRGEVETLRLNTESVG